MSSETQKAKKARKSARKKNTPKEKDVKVESVTYEKRRDFSTDLHDYLEGWKDRDRFPWKFNKVLQSYSIDNCLDGERIDEDLFRSMLPYISSIIGVASERLLTRCKDIATATDEVDDKVENKVVDMTKIQRAKEIIALLTT